MMIQLQWSLLLIYVRLFLIKQKQKQKLSQQKYTKKGKGVAGIYSYEVAEQKCVETVTEARRNGFPLDVTLEKTE
jgi:ATP-dependent Clp protease adapter protein ClpS